MRRPFLLCEYPPELLSKVANHLYGEVTRSKNMFWHVGPLIRHGVLCELQILLSALQEAGPESVRLAIAAAIVGNDSEGVSNLTRIHEELLEKELAMMKRLLRKLEIPLHLGRMDQLLPALSSFEFVEDIFASLWKSDANSDEASDLSVSSLAANTRSH